MTKTGENQLNAGPEGSIFLPRTERDIDTDQITLLLGRGYAAGLSDDERMTKYEENRRELDGLRQKVSPEMAVVALAS